MKVEEVVAVWSADCPPCPFCGEDGFDLPGLAWHVQGRCEAGEFAYEQQVKSLQESHERNVRRYLESKSNEGKGSDHA